MTKSHGWYAFIEVVLHVFKYYLSCGIKELYYEKEIVMGLADSFKRYRAARRTMNELSKLTDRELRDIGISRHEIRAVAYNKFG